MAISRSIFARIPFFIVMRKFYHFYIFFSLWRSCAFLRVCFVKITYYIPCYTPKMHPILYIGGVILTIHFFTSNFTPHFILGGVILTMNNSTSVFRCPNWTRLRVLSFKLQVNNHIVSHSERFIVYVYRFIQCFYFIFSVCFSIFP